MSFRDYIYIPGDMTRAIKRDLARAAQGMAGEAPRPEGSAPSGAPSPVAESDAPTPSRSNQSMVELTLKPFISVTCEGERCRCGAPAVRKVGEEIPIDDPQPRRHNLTAYVCAQHYAELMGPLGAEHVGLARIDTPPSSSTEVERLRDILDTERYKVAIGLQAVRKAIGARQWLSEPGRGSYTYDDERYQQEFGAALSEIEAALEPLRAIAGDWSDCPTDPLRVAANRDAARAPNTGDA